MNLRNSLGAFQPNRLIVIVALTLVAGFGKAAFGDAGNLTQTNALAVGEVILVKSSGSSVLIALEGVVRVLPAGPGKLAVSGIKPGRTDMVVLDDAGKTTERFVLVVGEEKPAPPVPPAAKPPHKIKVYDGSQMKEFEVRY